MLYYDRLEVSEGIDVNKTVHQRFDICNYWYFLNYSFTFQPNVCNRWHDLLNLSNIAILNIKDSDYCCIISLINRNEAIKLLQNANLTEKKEKQKWANKRLAISKLKTGLLFFRDIGI